MILFFGHSRSASKVLPSAFVSKKLNKGKTKKGAAVKITTYNRGIICLPKATARDGRNIKILRSKTREFLSRNGLIGKIQIDSSMSEMDLMQGI